MRKLSAVLFVAALLVSAPSMVEAQEGRSGIGSMLVGCCFGVRTAGEFNEGKDLHFRDWGRIIPLVSVVLAVWDGIQGYEGITTADLAEEYGSNYY